ncbi:B3 domain-containing transcription factor VRN1 [Abeliophyllum distichum]|uniref:B3 domain-containing transcription factor VRN1 n=1 Tax=Abeliophyllum distichum TaxID=126358 RepID=A0ABD1RQN8_9LAMI
MEDRPDLPTRFYKVVLPSTTFQHKLRIPDKFVVKYGHELSDIVQVIDSTGGVWYVRLEKAEKTLWLHDGWEKFVEDHSISYGYFLLFKYKGNSSFKVHIFDVTARDVDYPSNSRDFEGGSNQSTRNSISNFDEHSDDGSVKILAYFPGKPVACSPRRPVPNETMHDLSFSTEFGCGVKRGKSDAAGRSRSQRCYPTRSKCKIEDGVCEIKMENLNRSLSSEPVLNKSRKFEESKNQNFQKTIPCTGGNQKLSSNENQSSVDVESHLGKKAVHTSGIFLPKNPSFTVMLKPYNLYPSFTVNVPAAFAREYLPGVPGHIELHDCDGKKWLVRGSTRRGTVHNLAGGWGTFVKEKNLRVGDSCVFEAIHMNKSMLKVSTFCNTGTVPK